MKKNLCCLVTRLLWRMFVLAVIVSGTLVACQDSATPNPPVMQQWYLSSATPIRGAVVTLRGVEDSQALRAMQPLVFVSNPQDAEITLAFVSEDLVSGILFSVPAGTQLLSSQVVNAQDRLLDGVIQLSHSALASTTAQTTESQTLASQNIEVTHALEASFADFSLGDLDRNGFNLLDVVNLLKIVVSGEPPADAFTTYHADVTCDGILDLLDVLFVLRKLVNVPQAPPLCPPNPRVISGEPQVVLLGNTSITNKLAAGVIDFTVPAGMTLRRLSDGDAFGVALELTATESGVAELNIGGETLRMDVSVSDNPDPAPVSITLRLVGAETQENVPVAGLPLASVPLIINP